MPSNVTVVTVVQFWEGNTTTDFKRVRCTTRTLYLNPQLSPKTHKEQMILAHPKLKLL